MPTQKKRPKKGTSKKVYQVGCAKRRDTRSAKQRDTRSAKQRDTRSTKRSKSQKGGSASPFDQTTFLSRTMYPLETTGGLSNPIDATMQTGGRRRKRRYSRKYYKQSGGSGYFDKLMPSDVSQQPINDKFTESNPFRV